MTDTIIYKVLEHSAWKAACADGTFAGAPVDIADGFIHFSTATQVEETVAKHFNGQKELMLVAFDSSAFGDALKWEVSRGGALFPHLYDTLNPGLAIATYKLEDNPDGSHNFPETY